MVSRPMSSPTSSPLPMSARQPKGKARPYHSIFNLFSFASRWRALIRVKNWEYILLDQPADF